MSWWNLQTNLILSIFKATKFTTHLLWNSMCSIIQVKENFYSEIIKIVSKNTYNRSFK